MRCGTTVEPEILAVTSVNHVVHHDVKLTNRVSDKYITGEQC